MISRDDDQLLDNKKKQLNPYLVSVSPSTHSSDLAGAEGWLDWNNLLQWTGPIPGKEGDSINSKVLTSPSFPGIVPVSWDSIYLERKKRRRRRPNWLIRLIKISRWTTLTLIQDLLHSSSSPLFFNSGPVVKARRRLRHRARGGASSSHLPLLPFQSLPTQLRDGMERGVRFGRVQPLIPPFHHSIPPSHSMILIRGFTWEDNRDLT